MASIISAGTSAGTALNLTGDTSGILQLASNNGTVGLTVDASQNVGIGTTSPAAKLDITGSANGSFQLMVKNTNTGASAAAFVNTTNDNASNCQIATASSGYSGYGAWTANNGLLYANSNLCIMADSGGVIKFATGGNAETMRLSAGGNLVLKGGTVSATGVGITFPATQVSSSNANCLDDYEEGTWTPSVGGTSTYSLQTGTYTKIGNMVTVYYNMVVTSIGTGQTYGIVNLPFAVSNTGDGAVGYTGNTSNTKTASYNLWSYCDPNTTSLFYGGWTGSGVNSVPLQTVQNGTYLRGSCTYFTTT